MKIELSTIIDHATEMLDKAIDNRDDERDGLVNYHYFNGKVSALRDLLGTLSIYRDNVQPERMATVTVKNENGEIIAVLFTGLPVIIRERNGVTVDIN